MSGRSSSADGRARRGLLRRAVAVVVVVLSGLGLSGCWFRTYEWNQKVTVTVATPRGDVSGAAVSHMRVRIGNMPMTGKDQSNSFSGEATVVEVRPGTYLFALIGEDSMWVAVQAFSDALPPRNKDKIYGALERKRETIVLKPKLYPLLVTFGNLNEPRSVEQVDPANLAATFGPGYALKSITLEITDEPVTQGAVEKVIPWISTHRGRLRPPSLRLGPGSHNAADVLPVETLEEINFVREIK